MVMPRWRSSGALSIWSNADAWFSVGYLSCSTLVIAAVSVVLPWSMCPMVPMLTCGLVRSNLALATTGAPSGIRHALARRFLGGYGLVAGDPAVKFSRPYGSGQTEPYEQGASCDAAGSLAAGLLDDLVGDRLRGLGVGVELHRVRGLARGLRPQVADVAEHLRQRHEGVDDLVAVHVVHRLDLAATGVQVADDRAEVVLGGGHLDGHHGLEQGRVGLARSLLEDHRAGDLERELGGVDGVVGTVDQRHLDVLDRVARQHAE